MPRPSSLNTIPAAPPLGRPRPKRSRGARRALAALATVGALAALPAPAHASANTTTFWAANIPFAGRVIPAGQLSFLVHGSGLNIGYMYANWYAPKLCGWRLDWRIYANGTTWWSEKGPAHNGCTYAHGYQYRGNGWGPNGSKLCAELMDNATGDRIARACITLKH